MRTLLVAAAVAVMTATVAAIISAPALAADADPSLHQIYQAAQSGRLDRAQDMIGQVLRDHPRSARAHYVQAELFAREGQIASARAELGRAEDLAPGLPFAKPQAVQALRQQLAMSPRGEAGTAGSRNAFGDTAPRGAGLPWGTLVLIALTLGALWLLLRRREPNAPYANVLPGPAAAGGPYPGVAAPAGPLGGGLGSGIAGGLASGLAVGAGVVAGEELAHHLLDGGDRHERVVMPPSVTDGDWRSATNDMGGTDFGVNEASSWDDGASSGGGDDWT
jgi:hypothetical protein